jgi:hypothetical protein
MRNYEDAGREVAHSQPRNASELPGSYIVTPPRSQTQEDSSWRWNTQEAMHILESAQDDEDAELPSVTGQSSVREPSGVTESSSITEPSSVTEPSSLAKPSSFTISFHNNSPANNFIYSSPPQSPGPELPRNQEKLTREKKSFTGPELLQLVTAAVEVNPWNQPYGKGTKAWMTVAEMVKDHCRSFRALNRTCDTYKRKCEALLKWHTVRIFFCSFIELIYYFFRTELEKLC